MNNREKYQEKTRFKAITLNSINQDICIKKPILATLLERAKPDKKLMIRHGKDFSYQKKHLYILKKKANIILPSKIIRDKVVYINLGFMMIPAPNISIVQ